MRFFGKLLLLFLVVYSCLPIRCKAKDCDNRFVNFINPVRARQFWIDKSMKPIVSQKELLSKYGFKASWLVQYDVLADEELSSYIGFDKNDEIGLFFEVSSSFAKDSGVYYDQENEWYFPNVVFLSAYERNDRKKLIDTAFDKFYKRYLYWPKSVGVWWIDSYSYEYMKSKYGVVSFLIVADQKTTDNYGIWGQWWGYPYYAYDKNILVPGDKKSKSIVLQWAQRHPTMAYFGQGPLVSNYSLQANDYSSQGLGIDYFGDTLSNYLDCRNKIGQITIGMETGMEAYKYLKEYEEQLSHIKSLNINDVTASEMYLEYTKIYPNGNPEIIFGAKDKEWFLSKNERKNIFLGDKIDYQKLAFSDYFKSDKSSFLNRNLVDLFERKQIFYLPLHLLILPIVAMVYYKRTKNLYKTGLVLLSSLLTGLLFFKSYCGLGWCIYFGPQTNNLIFFQALIFIFLFIIFGYILKYIDLSLYILSFGIIYMLSVLRYTQIEGIKIVGILLNKFHLVGINNNLNFVNYDLGMLANSTVKINLTKIYANWKLYFVVMPLCQFLTAVVMKFIFSKLNKKLGFIVKAILIILTGLYVFSLLRSNPLSVL